MMKMIAVETLFAVSLGKTPKGLVKVLLADGINDYISPDKAIEYLTIIIY